MYMKKIKKLSISILLLINTLIPSEKMENISLTTDSSFIKYLKNDNYLQLTDINLLNNQKKISIKYFDKNNNLIWGKYFQTNNFVKFIDILKLNENNFIITGYEKLNNMEYDIFLIHYNKENGIEWQKNYTHTGIEIPSKLLLSKDNNLIICGFCAVKKNTYYSILTNDIHIIKTNLHGDRIWVKTIGLKEIDEELLDFLITNDNEIVLVAKRKFFKDNLYITKLNKFGNISWQNTYNIGNYIQDANILLSKTNSEIIINTLVLDMEYENQQITKKDLTLFINTDGEKIKTIENSSKNLDYKFSNDYNLYSSKKLTGIIKSNSVNIRRKPLLNSQVVTNLTKGEVVEIIEKSNKKYKISNMNDYWYHLKVDENNSGWIYGYFINIVP